MGEKGGCCRPPEDAPTSDALTQNLLHHAGRLDTGRGVVETLVFVGEAFVVDPETMQGGGTEVADVNGIFHDVVAEVVGHAMHATTGNSPTSHPHAKATTVVVAAGIQSALAVNTTTELAAPDDEGVVEHTALLKIGNQRSGRLVGVAALRVQVLDQGVVLIPAPVKELKQPTPPTIPRRIRISPPRPSLDLS